MPERLLLGHWVQIFLVELHFRFVFFAVHCAADSTEDTGGLPNSSSEWYPSECAFSRATVQSGESVITIFELFSNKLNRSFGVE